MEVIKTRLQSSSGSFYGITDFITAVEFRFTDKMNIFPCYNLHKLCLDNRLKKDVCEKCLLIGRRCHHEKRSVPAKHYIAISKLGTGVTEAQIYSAIIEVFNSLKKG